jgi:hypothetical protein
MAALGTLLLSPVLKLDRSLDLQLPGYFLRPSASLLAKDGRQDRLMAKLENVKAQIRVDTCRRSGFILLRGHICSQKNNS